MLNNFLTPDDSRIAKGSSAGLKNHETLESGIGIEATEFKVLQIG